MIVDGHCHVWENWPYQPPVPDSATRARAEQVLYEMDANGVERAVIICARIGDNPGNVDYAMQAAARHAGRFVVFPDLECRWSPDYRQPGAGERLEAALARWDFQGFTHYLDEADSGGWMIEEEGRNFFSLAESRALIASLSALPHQMASVIALAGLFPRLPILIHHFGFLGPRTAANPHALQQVLAAAACPNISIKYSGAGNVGSSGEYPYPDLRPAHDAVAAAFGPERLIWGSDYPVSRRHMTYAHSLAHLTRHGPFDAEGRKAVSGGNLARLLSRP